MTSFKKVYPATKMAVPKIQSIVKEVNKVNNCLDYKTPRNCISCMYYEKCNKTGFRFDMELIEIHNYIKILPKKET